MKALKRGKEASKKAKRSEADRQLDALWREVNVRKREAGRLKGGAD